MVGIAYYITQTEKGYTMSAEARDHFVNAPLKEEQHLAMMVIYEGMLCMATHTLMLLVTSSLAYSHAGH